MPSARNLNVWIDELLLWEQPLVLVNVEDGKSGTWLNERLTACFIVFHISAWGNPHGICLCQGCLCHLYCLFADEPTARIRCLRQRARQHVQLMRERNGEPAVCTLSSGHAPMLRDEALEELLRSVWEEKSESGFTWREVEKNRGE